MLGGRRSWRKAVVASALLVALALFFPSLSHPGPSLSDHKQEAFFFSPMGWTAAVFYPVGSALQSGLRAGYLFYSKAHPVSAMGEFVENKIGGYLEEATLKEDQAERLHPGFSLDVGKQSFISEDIARSVNIPPVK
jgi:hypothetical protein